MKYAPGLITCNEGGTEDGLACGRVEARFLASPTQVPDHERRWTKRVGAHQPQAPGLISRNEGGADDGLVGRQVEAWFLASATQAPQSSTPSTRCDEPRGKGVTTGTLPFLFLRGGAL